MCKYSIINIINKKVLNYIITWDEKNLLYLVEKDVFFGRFSVSIDLVLAYKPISFNSR